MPREAKGPVIIEKTDLIKGRVNSGVSNDEDKVECEDESDDEDNAICCKEGCKHEGGHEGKPSSDFLWLRCDIQSCKRWYHYHCVDVF